MFPHSPSNSSTDVRSHSLNSIALILPQQIRSNNLRKLKLLNLVFTPISLTSPKYAHTISIQNLQVR
jgi:hypothetical protein